MTTATLKTYLDAQLPLITTPNVNIVLSTLGVNDIAVTSEANFKADYLYIVDKIKARFPSANMYLSKVWKQGADPANVNTWIDYVIAQRSFCNAGHNETGWLEGGDNGATMTSDGVHYSDAGKTECAAQWKTILGY